MYTIHQPRTRTFRHLNFKFEFNLQNCMSLHTATCRWSGVMLWRIFGANFIDWEGETVVREQGWCGGRGVSDSSQVSGEDVVDAHQQKGELHSTSDCGDDKSTQKFQPHSINSEVFWRLLCTQNDSNSLVYRYNYLTYYNVFFMNCLVYATISTAFL